MNSPRSKRQAQSERLPKAAQPRPQHVSFVPIRWMARNFTDTVSSNTRKERIQGVNEALVKVFTLHGLPSRDPSQL